MLAAEAVDSLIRLLSVGGSAHIYDINTYWRARGYDRDLGDVEGFLIAHPCEFDIGAEGMVRRAEDTAAHPAMPGLAAPHPGALLGPVHPAAATLPPAPSALPALQSPPAGGMSPASQMGFQQDLLHSSRQLTQVTVAPAATSPPCWPQASEKVAPPRPACVSPPPLSPSAAAAAAPPAVGPRSPRGMSPVVAPALGNANAPLPAKGVLAQSLVSWLDSLVLLHGPSEVEGIVTGWLDSRGAAQAPLLPAAQPLPLPPAPPAVLPVVGAGEAVIGLPRRVAPPPVPVCEAPKLIPYTPHQEYRGVLDLLPAGGVSVTASSVSEGKPGDVVQCEPRLFSTQNERFSWFTVELHGAQCSPSHYTLAYAVPPHIRGMPAAHLSEKPRSWVLEASSDGLAYTVLSEHVDDDAFGPPERPHDVVVSFKIQDPVSGPYYRFFRVMQTGPNTAANNKFCASGFELYGLLQFV